MKETHLDKRKIDFEELYTEYKEFIYPFLFYLAGLLTVTLLFTKFSDNFNDFMKNCFVVDNENLTKLLFNYFSLYFTVFSLTVFLGLCMIGYPIINIIPLIYGFSIGCKICFYYVNYGFNGVAYSLLLIIPEASVFFITLIFTVKNSSLLSKQIYLLTVKKSDMTEELSFKSYLINYVKYAVYVALTATVNSLTTVFLQSIITL